MQIKHRTTVPIILFHKLNYVNVLSRGLSSVFDGSSKTFIGAYSFSSKDGGGGAENISSSGSGKPEGV